MGISQIFKVSRKTFFNPSAWLDLNSLRENTQTVWVILRDAFSTPEAEYSETFAEAQHRFGLSEEDLNKLAHTYYTYAIVLAGLGALCFLFSIVLLFWHHTFYGFLIGLPAVGLFLAQAFRYHFWYFQIINRKLGCTWEEWRKGKINEDESQ